MLYIRVDANQEIATGHVMRCMSIAGAFRRHGEEVTFLIADEQPCQLLEQQNYNYICLNSTWNCLENEIETMIDCIRQYKIQKLLIDSYYVTKQYLGRLSEHTKVIYLDDLGQFVYPVHMLINYNNYALHMKYEETYNHMKTKLLLGCQYVPLRDEFIGIKHPINESVNKVLITTGGSDNFNIAGKLMSFLLEQQTDCNQLQFHIVVGNFNKNKEELEKLAKKHAQVVLHYNVVKMSELMLQCEIAVTAGGSTMYELCACGVPMITYSFADNQLKGVQGFANSQIAPYAGDIRTGEQTVLDNIRREIKTYVEDSNARAHIAKKMKLLVDGEGTTRLYNEIYNSMKGNEK